MKLIKNSNNKGEMIMKILVLVDLQKDFIDGALGTPEAQAIVPNVVRKLENTNMEEVLVLFTKDTHYENYLDTLEGQLLPVKHCIENTPGWCINKEISSVVEGTYGRLIYSSDKIINSRIYKNTFGSDDLRDFLIEHKDDIEEIEFVGLCTSICVLSNAIMTRQTLPNTRVLVDASCCACVTPESHRHALEAMKMCQIEVVND